MFKMNMMCDRCTPGEFAIWCEEAGCYLCEACRKIEGYDDRGEPNADSQ